MTGRVEKNLITEQDLALGLDEKVQQKRQGKTYNLDKLSLLKITGSRATLAEQTNFQFSGVLVKDTGELAYFDDSDVSAEVELNPASWVVPNSLASDGSEGAYYLDTIGGGGAGSVQYAVADVNPGDTFLPFPFGSTPASAIVLLSINGSLITSTSYTRDTSGITLNNPSSGGEALFIRISLVAVSGIDAEDVDYGSSNVKEALDKRLETVDTLAELQAITGTSTEDVRYVTGVGHYQWDGAEWNPIDRPLTVAMFGLTDSANLVASFAAAMDYVSDTLGGGELYFTDPGTFEIETPIIHRDNVTVHLGPETHIYNVNASPGAQENAAWVMGSWHPADSDNFDYDELDAVTEGEQSVTFSTATDASKYQAGDVVAIVESQSTFGDSGGTLPAYIEVNEVLSADSGTGVVELKHQTEKTIAAGSGTLGTNATGAWMANVSWRANAGNDAGLPVRRHIVKNAHLRGGVFSTDNGGWMQRTGMFESDLEGFAVKKSAYGFFGNGFCRGWAKNFRAVFYTRAIELKYGSQHFAVENYLIDKDENSDQSGGEENPISIGEAARDVTIGRGTVNLGDHSSPDFVARFANSNDCKMKDMVVTGNGSHVSVLGFGSADVGSKAKNCQFRVGAVSSDNILLNGVGCEAEANTFADTAGGVNLNLGASCDGGRVIGNTFESDSEIESNTSNTGTVIANNKGLISVDSLDVLKNQSVYGNTGYDIQAIRAQAIPSSGAEIVKETTANNVVNSATYAADLPKVGDIYHWRIAGIITGSNDVKDLEFHIISDATDDTTVNYQAGAGDTPDFQLEVEIIVESATRVNATWRLYTDTTLEDAGSKRVTINNIDSQALEFELQAWVANASDAVQFRRISHWCERAGFATGAA